VTAHDPYQALRFRDFRLFLGGIFLSSLGAQMLTLALGWELYNRTGSALALGIVGLVQVLPILLLSLITGHVADHYDRRVVVVVSQGALILTALGLAALSDEKGPLVAVYGCLLLRGIGASFNGPAASVFLAEVVPEWGFENAASWRNSAGQLAAIVGPALGGVLIAVTRSPAVVYALSGIGSAALVVALLQVRTAGPAAAARHLTRERPTLRSLGEGITYLRRTPVILWAITLDLFAVLFGGATTLLPIFAKDILRVGPLGLGWLVAAPSLGAIAVSLFLAHRPSMQRAGPTFLLAVFGFGLATIVFGLSHSFWLSMGMLLTLGGLDSVSMVVRDTLMLTRIPNHMRGRVAAIEGVFVSSSNQLGGFESGVTAQFVGPVLSVVGGGIGTILVVLLVTVAASELRHLQGLRPVIDEIERSPSVGSAGG
jgi:MFS family permease